MQLSTDVMDLLLTEPIIELLMSLVSPFYNSRTRIRLTDANIETATRYCDVTVVELLDPCHLLSRSIKFKRLDLLQLYYRWRPQLLKELYDQHHASMYVESRRPPVWIKNNIYPWDISVCQAIAMEGNLEMLKWAREHGCPWSASTFTHAAASGNLELVEWCKENGCPWNASTCSQAAASGNLELVQWCYNKGCGWDLDTADRAAFACHWGLLKWCLSHGCSWDSRVCHAAARQGRLDILQWVQANDYDWDVEDCLKAAIDTKQLHIVAWINSQ
jgi:hypothetical protein